MRVCHFRVQNSPFILKKFFLVQTIIITFIYLLVVFTVQNWKKKFQRIQSYEDAQFLGPKWPISPNENFFRKPVHEPCFFHSRLSTCQKSKSDINLFVKYWRLKNTEISLAESLFWLTWEPDFSQACSFHRMLMNHVNFNFTQIPSNTNGMIILKSPKTMSLSHFWPFLVIFAQYRFFPKNLALSHNYIWAPVTMLSFRKN